MLNKACPCVSRRTFENCCSPFIDGRAVAEQPEQLMRSRFSAFSIGNIDYLINTHHISTRSTTLRGALERDMRDIDWLGLSVIQASPVSSLEPRGFVEFVALYKRAQLYEGRIEQLHEKSMFIKEKARWFYISGEQLPPYKFSRNAPCWCGSGKKIKHCHTTSVI